MSPPAELRAVTPENWRACADLRVADDQDDFVSPVTRYLCLCHYGGVWSPYAVYAANTKTKRSSSASPSPARDGKRTPGGSAGRGRRAFRPPPAADVFHRRHFRVYSLPVAHVAQLD